MDEKKKPNWIKIRTEYETTNTSYAKLAEKYKKDGVKLTTLQKRAVRESWTKSKVENCNEIATKLLQKVNEKNIYDMAVELEATSLINKLILETLQDAKQYNRQLITKKEKYPTGKVKGYDEDGNPIMVSEQQWVEEQEFSVLDTKRLAETARTLETASKLKRLLFGIIDPATREKLDIDKQKAEQEDKNTIIQVISNIPRPPKEDDDGKTDIS
jgi:hypothetical protein